MNKKLATILLIISLFITLGFDTDAMNGLVQPVQAAPPITLKIKNQIVQSDVPPIIYEGRTLVPVRVVSEHLGAKVDWIQGSQTAIVKSDGDVISFKLNVKQYQVNNENKDLDVSIQMRNNRILIPLRAVSQALGHKVSWDGKNRLVTVFDKNIAVKPENQAKDELIAHTGIVIIKTNVGTVYNNPSTAGEKIHEAKKADRFDSTGKKGTWYRIILPTGKTGWVDEGQVDFEPIGPTTPPPATPNQPLASPSKSETGAQVIDKAVEVTANVVNIRRGPGTNYGKVGQVKLGNRFQAVSKENGWYQIRYTDGNNWWIFGELVKEISNESVAKPTPQPSTPANGGLTVKKKDSIVGQSTITFDVKDSKVNVILNNGNVLKLSIDGISLNQDLGNPVAGVAPFTGMTIEKTGTKQVRITCTVTNPGYFRLDRKGDELSITAVAKHKNGTMGLAGKTIVISPGHGNYANGTVDPGAIGKAYGTSEVMFNTPVALKLRKKLEVAGAKVLMVREWSPVHTTLYQRAQLANDNNADAFISIHGDSAPSNPNASGIGVYMYDGNLRLTSAAQTTIRKDFSNTMRKELSKATGAKASVRVANFAVLRENEVPSVLIECGFLSNPREEKLLASDAYQEKLAQGMFNGLNAWFAK